MTRKRRFPLEWTINVTISSANAAKRLDRNLGCEKMAEQRALP